MNIKEFSQKNSVALFWTAVVLAVLLIIEAMFSLGGQGGPSGGMPQGQGQNMPQAQNQPMQPSSDQGNAQQQGGPVQGAPSDTGGTAQ